MHLRQKYGPTIRGSNLVPFEQKALLLANHGNHSMPYSKTVICFSPTILNLTTMSAIFHDNEQEEEEEQENGNDDGDDDDNDEKGDERRRIEEEK